MSKRRRMGPHIFPTPRAFGMHFKKWHVFVTFCFLFIPLIFFYFVAHISHVDPKLIFIDLTQSITRIVIAYVASIVTGFILAVALYRNRFGTFLLPFLDALQSFPTSAALPLAVIFWGPNEVTVIFFLFFNIVWPIFFTVMSSLKLIHPEWEEAMEMSGIKGWKYTKIFLIPAAVPALITGSIIGLGNAWEALVATEIIVGIKQGFGPFFQAFSSNPKITAFGIAGLLLIVFSINKLVWLPLLERSHKMHEE